MSEFLEVRSFIKSLFAFLYISQRACAYSRKSNSSDVSPAGHRTMPQKAQIRWLAYVGASFVHHKYMKLFKLTRIAIIIKIKMSDSSFSALSKRTLETNRIILQNLSRCTQVFSGKFQNSAIVPGGGLLLFFQDFAFRSSDFGGHFQKTVRKLH